MSRVVTEIWTRQYAPSAAGTTAIFTIPKGFAVIGLYARKDVARVGGTSVTVGESGGDVDGYFTESGIASDATGIKAADGAFLNQQGGHIQASEDTIDAILTGTPSTMPVIQFAAIVRHIFPGG